VLASVRPSAYPLIRKPHEIPQTMTPPLRSFPVLPILGLWTLAMGCPSFAQSPAVFSSIQRLTNGTVDLRWTAPNGSLHRIESSSDLLTWQGLVTATGSTTAKLVTDGTPDSGQPRFYRAVSVTDPLAITGDHVRTDQGEVTVHPVNHASFVLRWGDRFLYNDPVGSTAAYQGIGRPDLILVSHSHGDHFSSATLDGLQKAGTVIIAPAAVYSSLSAKLKALTIPLANGQQTNVLGFNIEAIPAYNGNHPKGSGNGYVATIDGRRFFMSGDTGNIPEMRALTAIDVAFVCMNVPFTMTIPEALTAVRAFQPRVVYPYHYRNQDGSSADLAGFKKQIANEPSIEVRLRGWY
jgi:L-ascorbate metabolism protein UlaG (beta-lactamase superfamily)